MTRPDLDPVLIVDVNPLSRMLAEETLQNLLFQTVAVAEWTSVRPRLAGRRPGMVLMDLDVTPMPLDEVKAVLAPAEGTPPLAVGMCTTEDAGILGTYRAAGITAILQKPFGQAELMEVLEAAPLRNG